MTADSTPRRHSRGRRYMTGLVLVLACISLLASVLVTWAHQTVLNTDRYVRVVSEVQQDPAVQTEMAAFISKQVVDALGVQARVADALPAKAGFLAVPVAAAVERTLDEQLVKVVASPQFATVWEEGNRLVHAQLVRALRGDTTVLTVNDGMVTFNLYPLVGKALTALQEQGFIPAGVTLPEFSGTAVPDETRTKLETALGITLPATFGQMPLFRAERLASLQAAVKAFDILMVALWLVSAVLILLAIWLAAARLRMVVYLGVGTVITFLVARLIVAAVQKTVVSSLAESTGLASIRDTVEVFVHDLFGLVWILVIGAVIVTLVAYFAGRPRWAVSAAASVSGAAGRAGATGTTAGAAGTTAVVAGAGAYGRAHRSELRLAGVAVVAFIIIWMAVGIEVAVLAGALMTAWFVLLGRGDEDEPSGEVKEQKTAPA